MKTRIIALLIFALVSSLSRAQENKSGSEFVNAAGGAIELVEVISAVGSPPSNCTHCPDKEAHQKIVADKKEINLANPYYNKNEGPYIVRLIRNAKTPKKLKLKFKNSEKVCQTFVNEQRVFECWVQKNEYTDNDIQMDFTNLPIIKEGDSEIIEIKFFKNDPDRYKYFITAERLTVNASKAKVSAYFFGDGFDVKFESDRLNH